MAENVVINFVGNDGVSPAAKKAEGAIKDVAGAAESTGSKFDGMKEIAKGAFSAIGGFALNAASAIAGTVVSGITDIAKNSFKAAVDAERSFSQLEAVIESTGMMAGWSAEEVDQLANELSAASGRSVFGDEAIRDAQSILLTFTQIQGTNFATATESILDMSQALGMDLNSASMMVGKALNDPIKGMAALGRSGVSFTADQKALVEAMMDVGDVAGAQKVIMDEMAVQFGGSAAKATETLEGKMKIFNERLGDIYEVIGNALMPIMTKLASLVLTHVLPIVGQLGQVLNESLASIPWDAIYEQINSVVTSLISMGTAIDWSFFSAGMNSIYAVIMRGQPFFDAFLGHIMRMYQAFTGPDAKSAASGFSSVIGMIVNVLGGLISTIVSTVTSVLSALSPIVAGIVEMAFRILGAITETLSGSEMNNAFAQFQVLFATVGVVVKELAEIISVVLGYALDGLRIAFDFLWPVIDFVFKQLMNAVSFVIPIVVGLLNSVIMVLKGDFAGAWTNINVVISKAWSDIQTAVQKGIDAVKATLTEWINSASSFGSDLAAGIAKGITAGAGQIANAAKDAAMNALKAAKALLGISSPSKMFADAIGEPISQGIAAGIAKGAPEINGALGMTLGGAAGGTQQTVQNYYLSATYNQRQSESSIMADLRAMQLLSGAV
jgi:phage-related protein